MGFLEIYSWMDLDFGLTKRCLVISISYVLISVYKDWGDRPSLASVASEAFCRKQALKGLHRPCAALSTFRQCPGALSPHPHNMGILGPRSANIRWPAFRIDLLGGRVLRRLNNRNRDGGKACSCHSTRRCLTPLLSRGGQDGCRRCPASRISGNRTRSCSIFFRRHRDRRASSLVQKPYDCRLL